MKQPLLILLSLLLTACSLFSTAPAQADRTTNTQSSDLATEAERLDFLAQYVVLKSPVDAAEFHIVYHDNSGGFVPGPSDWDIRAVMHVTDVVAWTEGKTRVDLFDLSWADDLFSDTLRPQRPARLLRKCCCATCRLCAGTDYPAALHHLCPMKRIALLALFLIALLALAACQPERGLLELTPDGLPDGMRMFYTEEPPDCNHCPVIVLRVDGQRFSSQQEDSFEQLLRHYDYLETDSLSVEQLAMLRNSLHPSERAMMLDPEMIEEQPYASATGRASTEPPSVVHNADGSATLVYWVTDFESITKLTVTIRPDYTTATEFETFPRWQEP